MEKFYKVISGNTLDSHQKFVQQLIKGGATEVDSPDKSDVIIFFCPIISRLGTDITAALSNISELCGCKPVILVVMHHTFNPELTVADSSRLVNSSSVQLVVDCLFYETKGLLDCPRNENAVTEVLKQMDLPKSSSQIFSTLWQKYVSGCTQCKQKDGQLRKKNQQLKEMKAEIEKLKQELEELRKLKDKPEHPEKLQREEKANMEEQREGIEALKESNIQPEHQG
uniref:Uncharacterized protein n=1 Tax=Myripristis murdjan TaxID=586833 RepID=A0A667XLD3_9TELE